MFSSEFMAIFTNGIPHNIIGGTLDSHRFVKVGEDF